MEKGTFLEQGGTEFAKATLTASTRKNHVGAFIA
jgi:hypothetical protein